MAGRPNRTDKWLTASLFTRLVLNGFVNLYLGKKANINDYFSQQEKQ